MDTQSEYMLASYPARFLCVGREKRAWYTLFAHTQDFWEFGTFRFVTLTSVRHADFSCMKMSATDHALYEGATKAPSSSFAEIVHMLIHSS